MAPVFIKRGSLETDVHTRRTPCEDEGRVYKTRSVREGQSAGSSWGRRGQSPPHRAQTELMPDFQSDWEIVQHLSVPQVGVLFTTVSAN